MILNVFSKFLGLFGVLMILTIVSCKDSDVPSDNSQKETCNINKENLFGSWVITGVTINPAIDLGNGPVTDIYATWDECRKDDRDQLLSNGSYLGIEGLNQCPEPYQFSGTWEFDPLNCKVSLAVNGNSTTVWEVQSVSAMQLSVKVKVRINDKDYVETRTYKKY